MLTLNIENQEKTIAIAEKLTSFLTEGMTILLQGDLGAGKTTFTKGIGSGLGIKRMIKSPTYTIIREYKDGRLPLYHIDLYRLGEGEAFDLGLYEYFEGTGISVVEWPSIAPEEMPENHLEITLKTDLSDSNKRTIVLKAVGEQYKKLLLAFQKSIAKDGKN